MRKLVITFTLLITLTLSAYFVNTPYFFNRFIAPNIQKYNFTYSEVNGNIFRGFTIEDLKYKNSLLSSKVEMRFNPFKLLDKTIYISTLKLINVNTKTLDRVIKDFKSTSSDSSNSSLNIDLEFELHNIILSFQKFKFKMVEVNSNSLNIDYIIYKNNLLSLGDTKFFFFTNFGKIFFDGEFNNRVLTIDKINIKELDIKKILSKLKEFKQNSTPTKNGTNSSTKLSSIPYIPKRIYINSGLLTLKPFKFKKVSSRDLKVELKDANFDLEKLKLKNISFNLKYSSNLAKFLIQSNYKGDTLNIYSVDINISKPQEIEKLIKELTKGGKKSSLSINSERERLKKAKSGSLKIVDVANVKPQSSGSKFIDLKNIKVRYFNLRAKNYQYMSEKVDEVSLRGKNIYFGIESKLLDITDIFLDIRSSLGEVSLVGSYQKDIFIDDANIYIKDGNRLLTLFNSNRGSKGTQNSSNGNSSLKIPKNLFIRRFNLDINSLTFSKFNIKSGQIEAKNLHSDLESGDVVKGDLDLNLKSNFGIAELTGYIRNTQYFAKGEYNVSKEVSKIYSAPLKVENIKPLKVSGRFGKSDLSLKVKLRGDDILTPLKGFDIKDSTNQISYHYKKKRFVWKFDGDINTTYSGLAKLQNSLEYDKKLSYSGTLIPKNIPSYLKNSFLFEDLTILYQGDKSRVVANLKSKYLFAVFKSIGYKKGDIYLKNRVPIALSRFLNLPKELKDTKITRFDVKTAINFKKPLPIKGQLKLSSNLVNFNGLLTYDKNIASNLILRLPKNSLLYRYKGIKHKALFPLRLKLSLIDSTFKAFFKNRVLTGEMEYNDYLQATVKGDSFEAIVDGELSNLKVDISTENINATLQDISKVYRLKDIPPIYGSLNINLNLNKETKFKITSPKITYEPPNSTTTIKDLMIEGKFAKSNLRINSYKLNVKGYDIYSTKQSTLYFKGDTIDINSFWINNSLLITGLYNLKRSRAKLSVKANNFRIANKDFKVNLSLNNKIILNGEKIYASGRITVLKSLIKKSIKPNSVDDEDIIIIQKKEQKKSTNFAKNFKLDLLINSKRAVVYKDSNAYFLLYPNLKIIKDYNSLTILKGKVKISKKSYYKLSGKKLRVSSGVVTFKGKSSTPYLNIILVYKGQEYTININVSGTATRPILYFSSNPPLTKNQILAYLLFGDTTAVGTHSQKSMLDVIGGSLAKSFLGTLGIQIDYISIKDDGFSIGKSITDDITVYYNQDGEKASIKTRIDIKKSVHTEIEVGSESQSVDIIFSKEY